MFSAWIAAFSAVFWIISFTWSTALTDSFSEFIALAAIVFPLSISFIESSDSMNQVMVGINKSSDQVSIGAAELATASQVLAKSYN